LIPAILTLTGCVTAGAGADPDRGDQLAEPPELVCRDDDVWTCLETLGRKTQCFCADRKSMRDLLEPKPRQFR